MKASFSYLNCKNNKQNYPKLKTTELIAPPGKCMEKNIEKLIKSVSFMNTQFDDFNFEIDNVTIELKNIKIENGKVISEINYC